MTGRLRRGVRERCQRTTARAVRRNVSTASVTATAGSPICSPPPLSAAPKNCPSKSETIRKYSALILVWLVCEAISDNDDDDDWREDSSSSGSGSDKSNRKSGSRPKIRVFRFGAWGQKSWFRLGRNELKNPRNRIGSIGRFRFPTRSAWYANDRNGQRTGQV